MKRLIATVASLVLLASCGGDDTGSGSRPSSSATISIVSPAANEAVSGDTLTVEVALEGGRVVEEVSQVVTPDEGHVHITIDGSIITQDGGLTEEVEMPDPGRHLLQAEFAAKDHGPFEPRVLDTVTFEVVAE